MSEMIERVAKALCMKRILRNADIEGRTLDQEFIDRAVEAGHPNFLVDAYIAIKAMREPTEAMKHAINEYGDEIHYSYSCQVCGGVAEGYKAMIDAALKDG